MVPLRYFNVAGRRSAAALGPIEPTATHSSRSPARQPRAGGLEDIFGNRLSTPDGTGVRELHPRHGSRRGACDAARLSQGRRREHHLQLWLRSRLLGSAGIDMVKQVSASIQGQRVRYVRRRSAAIVAKADKVRALLGCSRSTPPRGDRQLGLCVGGNTCSAEIARLVFRASCAL